MTREPRTVRVTVPKTRATLGVLSRAALEMTSSCYVWLESEPKATVVTLEEQQRGASDQDVEGRFYQELDRARAMERLRKTVGPVRAVLAGRVLGPAPTSNTAKGVPAPALDPETEAEIEKLLAEIEGEDWLADAGEIGKTWEERFGADGKKDDKGES